MPVFAEYFIRIFRALQIARRTSPRRDKENGPLGIHDRSPFLRGTFLQNAFANDTQSRMIAVWISNVFAISCKSDLVFFTVDGSAETIVLRCTLLNDP